MKQMKKLKKYVKKQVKKAAAGNAASSNSRTKSSFGAIEEESDEGSDSYWRILSSQQWLGSYVSTKSAYGLNM